MLGDRGETSWKEAAETLKKSLRGALAHSQGRGRIQCDPQNGHHCPPSSVFLLALCGLFSKIFAILSQTS